MNIFKIFQWRPLALIVEDDETTAKAEARLLKKMNINSIISPSAEDALDIISGYDIDIVLLDFHLPMMNGGEFAKHVKKIPIIYISGDQSIKPLLSSSDLFIHKSEYVELLEPYVRILLPDYFKKEKKAS